jgi:hypothetical protein
VVNDVAWSADGNEVWALGPGLVMMWRVREGVLVDAPEEHFEAVLPAHDAGAVWVVARNGQLREISTAEGRPGRVLRVPDTITSAAGSRDGTVAAVSGRRGLWIVRLTGANAGATRRIAPAGCAL